MYFTIKYRALLTSEIETANSLLIVRREIRNENKKIKLQREKSRRLNSFSFIFLSLYTLQTPISIENRWVRHRIIYDLK